MGKAKRDLFVGVDVGGTNIACALVTREGEVVSRDKKRTPAEGTPQDALDAIESAIEGLLEAAETDPSDVACIGVGVPGVVLPGEGRVVVTPNMNLGGINVSEALGKKFGPPVFLGNDCDLCTMGEAWLGAAKGASSALGMFIGTGIGGGLMVNGHVVQGVRNMAGEIGHMVMQMDGPQCGCGNRGCLEAMASRTAMERDLRLAVAAGRETWMEDVLDGDTGRVKSKKWKKALKKDDELAWEIIRRAFSVIGYACISLRHIFDPQVIVLGGGVVEACEKYVMPVVQEVVATDAFEGAAPAGEVVASTLGDDAGVLGAAAYAIDMLTSGGK